MGHGQKRLGWSAVTALALALTLGTAASARAESGVWNLHIDGGLAIPVAGELIPEGGGQIPLGGIGALSVDWQLATPFALELLVGGGYIAGGYPMTGDSGTVYFTSGIGGRIRFLDNQEGYANEPAGDYLGNTWVSAHLGYARFDGNQIGIDLGGGYEWSVFKPIQLGLFIRGQLLLLGDHDKIDAVLYGGVNASFELSGRAPSLDTDGDTLSDEREVSHFGTDPNNPDTDNDGLRDNIEVTTNTNPTNPDTDGDSLLDGAEDASHDGTPDANESDPRIADTDSGGCNDGWEATQSPPHNARDRADDNRDADNVPDCNDACPDTAANTEVDQRGCAVMRAEMVFTGITFAFDSAEILPESEATLQSALQILRDNAGVRVRVEGHTDNVGGDAYNMRLSRSRADAVKTWLTQHGIQAARMETRGMGLRHPRAPNDTEEGRAQNRRIEFHRLGGE